MITQTLSRRSAGQGPLPHPWGGAAQDLHGRGAGRRHRHAERSAGVVLPSLSRAVRGTTATWTLLGLPLKAALMSAAVLALVAQTHGQNYVLNGSFESPVISSNTFDFLPTIPGWSTPNAGAHLELWNHYASIPSTEGDQHLEINSDLLDQTVLQSVSVLSGVLTRFSFDYTGRQFTDNTFTVTVTGDVSNISYVNTTLNPATHYLSHRWDTFSATFTPGLTDSMLTIAFRGHPIAPIAGAAHIDNVSLTAVPEPSEFAAAVAGLGLVAFSEWRRTRR